MEKNKLKFSRIGKKGIIIPALLAAGMLNCAAETFHKSPSSKYTSTGNKTLVYEQNASKFNERDTQNTLQTILRSDLNQLSEYDRLESKVQNEVAGYLSNMNADSLALALQYKSLEEHTFMHSGLTKEQINYIASNNFIGSNNQDNLKIVRSSMQHNMHMTLDTLTLIRFGASEAEISHLDEGDQHNEYLRFNTKGKRSISKESNAVLNLAENDIINYTNYEYLVNGKSGEKISMQISSNLQKIKKLVTTISNKQFSQKNYNDLLKIINSTAELLPEQMFGTIAMRRALITEFTSQYSINNLIFNITKLGYDIDNIKSSVFIEQDKKTTFDLSAKYNVTNTHNDTVLGTKWNTPLLKNWNITYGAELGVVDTKSENNEYQVLGNLGVGKTFNNGSTLSLEAKTGIQFNEKNISMPFGANIGYNWKINDNISLDFGVNTLVQHNKNVDFGGGIGVKFRTKSMIMSVGINGGYSVDLTPASKPNSTPEKEKYGSEEIIKPDDDDVTDQGDGTIPDEVSVDDEDLEQLL